MRPLAGRVRQFGVVVTHGRKSGTRYETPVNVFDTDDGVVIALTYGEQVDWLKNVIAAGECEIVRSGDTQQFQSPIVVDGDEALAYFPSVVRPILGALGVERFLLLTTK
jgi:deazaflavin-dependent oxidoreductase (nitroreductase family)